MRDLLDRTGLVNSIQGYGLGQTWPAGAALAGIPIDHCLHSSDLVTLERTVADIEGSDHRALHVTLGWAQEQHIAVDESVSE